MTRADQPMGVAPTSDAPDDALAAESRERAVGALLRFGPLRRLWSAHLTSGIGDALALLVLVLLALQAAAVRASGADAVFGGGYRGMALVIPAVFAARLLATLLFGAVLLGPLSSLLAPGKGVLDRRWTMFGADALRALALIVAPMWVDWMPAKAFPLVLITVFVLGVAERFWTVAKDSAAPGLLPAPPPEGAAVRPLPDRQDALRRLWLRSTFMALPVAAIGLVVVTLISNALSSAFDWFHTHQAALGSYVAAGLFAAALSVVYFLELPDGGTSRPRSPLEGLRRPKGGSGAGDGKGRTGAVPLLVLAGAATAWAVASAVALAALHAADLGGGPISFGLQVFVLAGGTAAGIRLAPRTLPLLSRRRLLALAVGLAGLALLVAGLVTDATTGIVLMTVAGLSAGVAAQAGHVLLDQETEAAHRARMTEHLQAIVRIAIGLGALIAPVAAGFIGPHRVVAGDFVFDHGGAAFTLTLVGALLLPVAALVLGRTDDRQGVTLRRDLLDALGGGQPKEAPAGSGFFIALEGGDGSGKTTQVETLAEWIRAKGHEVVVTKEPGATPVGKRLRSILLDVSSSGLSHRSEALLYAADRAEHVDTVVRPALERGAIVISDRYIDSSVAYQGAGRDLSPTEIARISRWATAGLVPHLTVLLDIAPETARERFTEAPDRLESEPAEFHGKVRSGFLTLAAADPARYLVVDAAQEPEAVTTAVRHRLDEVLPLSEAEIQAREDARRAAEEEARRKAEEEAARKAEEERQERERQEQMARLRAEEEERKQRAEELERQQAEARRAEEARRRAEEARRIAEEERKRREAEERVREEEIARQRRLAEEEARLRAQAEERRQEKQRRAEEALQRAERSRNRGGSDPDGSDGDTAKLPQPDEPQDESGGDREDGGDGGSGTGAGGASASASGSGSGSARGTAAESDAERTHVMPQAREPWSPGSGSGSSGSGSSGSGSASGTGRARQDEETTLLPRVSPDEPEHRDRTREIPQVDPEPGRGSRPRPEWAEETPLDDVPSLADELLGSGEEEDEPGGRRRRRGK